MPRRLRFHVAGGFYHATLRGNHRQDIFRFSADRHVLNAVVAESILKYGARVHAYCWMSNHLHFLVQVGDEPLSAVMRHIASRYARAFQRRLDTTGHLFERRYHAVLVDADSYLFQLLRYIHLNPVRAGLVQKPGLYQWSSHHAYAGGPREDWLTTDFALSMFAADRHSAHAAYRRFVDSPESDDDLESFGAKDTPILGSADFVKSLSKTDPPNFPQQSLDCLVDEACLMFGTSKTELRSKSRQPAPVKARAWIAIQAISRRVATLSSVARALDRDRATLRYAMRRHKFTAA